MKQIYQITFYKTTLCNSDSVELKKYKIFSWQNDWEKRSKKINKYITTLDYADNALLVLSVARSSVSLCSFATVVATTSGIASVSIGLVFLVVNRFLKMYLKTMKKGRNKNRAIVLLASCKLNSIDKRISKVQMMLRLVRKNLP